MSSNIDEIKNKKKEWEEKVLKPALDGFGYTEPPFRTYTPTDIEDFDFLDKVGFPGQYPFTAGIYAVQARMPAPRVGRPRASRRSQSQAIEQRRAAGYSGYGTAEDTRDYYKEMISRGGRGGPNLAFDLPTQCGYDSDNPIVRGDVGKTGVTVDTLRDFEIIYEPYQGELDLDRIASNFTINAPSNIFIAMYCALADKRGIPFERLRATPQNDILKEFIARGTYIFPPKPSMRMFRDSMVFLTKYCPRVNLTSIGGYHIRGAGATREQDLAFSLVILAAYLQEGINAGLDIDTFAPRFTINQFGGSMELFKEVAFHRASRRMWAKVIKEKFGAKNERSMLLRGGGLAAHIGCENTTIQRPINNLTRSVIGAVASALSGGGGVAYPPYDEPIRMGGSLEASQLSSDASRIIQYEAKLGEVRDPLAGSYYIESLTNEIEEAAWKEFEKIEAMGGAVAAIENGYMWREIARSAHDRQRRLETGEDLMVGVNCFVSENELELEIKRLVPDTYDPVRREQAEEKQIRDLTELKKQRDNRAVAQLLSELKEKAKKEDENLIPHFIECAKAYVSEQEMCDVLREVFGEYQPVSL